MQHKATGPRCFPGDNQGQLSIYFCAGIEYIRIMEYDAFSPMVVHLQSPIENCRGKLKVQNATRWSLGCTTLVRRFVLNVFFLKKNHFAKDCESIDKNHTFIYSKVFQCPAPSTACSYSDWYVPLLGPAFLPLVKVCCHYIMLFSTLISASKLTHFSCIFCVSVRSCIYSPRSMRRLQHKLRLVPALPIRRNLRQILSQQCFRLCPLWHAPERH